MSYTYARREHTGNAAKTARPAKGPGIGELAAGARPSAEQMGHRVDLPEAVREKMEASFGADFSNVKLYESQTVADAGAEAMTQGQNVAFAPGRLDLTSTAGQALLGHELSHVVSQARGESAGRGFLNDPHMEAQADRQGMLAAQGGSAYEGPVTPIGASSAAPVSGPMQAKKPDTVNAEKEAALEGKTLPGYMHPIRRSRVKKEYLDKRRDRLKKSRWATEVLDEVNGRLAAGKTLYDDAVQTYMDGKGEAGGTYGGTVKTKYDALRIGRYMQTSMINRNEDERQQMLEAFSEGGDEDQAIGFLVDDIKKYGTAQSDDALSDDDRTVLGTYARDGVVGAHHGHIRDLIRSDGFDMSKLVGEGRLTQEELDNFMANPYSKDLWSASTMAQGLKLMGTGSPNDYAEGKNLYESAGAGYRRMRKAGRNLQYGRSRGSGNA